MKETIAGAVVAVLVSFFIVKALDLFIQDYQIITYAQETSP